MRRSAVGVAVVLGLAVGCAPKDVFYKVAIVTTGCDPANDPFEGVQYLKVRVLGDGLDKPLEATSTKDASTKEVKIPNIPNGKNRVVEVRAYDGDPASGGTVVSMGRSLPFDVPDVVPLDLKGPIAINIVLRKVGVFSRPVAADAPTDCARMSVARAGHTATLLNNGKVFIAGGFNLQNSGTVKTALYDAELYDPATGTFAKAQDLSISNGSVKLAKAFHTATLLPGGLVMLWGGETYQQSGAVSAPNAVVLIYNPAADEYGAVKSRTSPKSFSRTRHSAAIDANGKVLIVGGLTRDIPDGGTQPTLLPEDKVEWFDPSTNEAKVVDAITVSRMDMAVSPVKAGEYVAVAGGSDGVPGTPAMATPEVLFFKYDGTAFRQQPLSNPPRLASPGRRAAGVATLRDGQDMLLLGGYTDAASVKPVATSEIVSTSSATVNMGPTVGSRGNICAVNLPDGRVMAIGGRTVDALGSPSHSDGSSVFVQADAAGGVTAMGGPNLAAPRYAHTCTALLDGTVLVLGGINEATDGSQTILQDAWIYQPKPTD